MNKDEDFLNEYLSEIYFKEQNGIIIGSVFCFIFGFGGMLSSCTKEGDVSHFFMGFLLAMFGGILWGINSSTIDDKTKKKKTISHVIFRQRLIMVLSAYARAKTLYFFFKKGC